MSDELVEAIAETIYDMMSVDGVENPAFRELEGTSLYIGFISMGDAIIDLFPDYEEEVRNIIDNE